MIALLLLAAAADTLPPPDDATVFGVARDRVAAVYDSARGGFVAWKSGVPHEAAVELGLTLGQGDPADDWTRRSLVTMRWTRGLLDTIGGGYMHASRGTTMDDGHFEKRTDSNAWRLENHILAWRLMGDESERRAAVRLVDFFDRILLDGRGGFVAAQVGDRELEPRSNGIAIHAWLSWAAATGETRYRDFALRSLERVWENCLDEELGVLLRKGTFGEILSPPKLVDQCEMGRAHVLAAHLTGRDTDRIRARALGDLLLERFEDPEKHGFRTQAVVGRGGKVRKADRDFEENARAALFLCELTTLTGDARYQDAARRAWQAFYKDFSDAKFEAADWALALRAALEPEVPPAPEWKQVAQQSAPKKSFRFKLRR